MTRVGVGKYFAGFRVILHKGTQRTIGFFANPFKTQFSANFIPSKLYLSLGSIFGG
jgi:hypothetical protein